MGEGEGEDLNSRSRGWCAGCEVLVATCVCKGREGRYGGLAVREEISRQEFDGRIGADRGIVFLWR